MERSAEALAGGRVPSRGEPAPETVDSRAVNKKVSVRLGLIRTEWAVDVVGVSASIVAKEQCLME
jgi:hypothetical protein